ncbi:MAG TPA: sigma-70 family RNA polymerase sigma factor [Thermoguttaceae bacterium]|nr:sigma-70 family RNA polymerase sigma factor [Thermoguttaceae bacterium]
MSAEESTSGVDLVRRLREGDSRAAEELYARYVRQLVRLAERQLGGRLAARFDAEDVVQSAFRSFFRRDARGDFEVGSSLELWRLLVKITVNKTRAKARHHTTRGRDVAAEAPAGEALVAEALARGPGPDDAAAFVDQVAALLRGLPEPYGQILDMRLTGHSVAEIANTLKVSRQTVYRVMDLLRQRLQKEAAAPSG